MTKFFVCPIGGWPGVAEGIRIASMSRRNMRTQNEWKVEITGLAMLSPPTSFSTRSPISAAALLVNVIARMDSGITPFVLDQIGDAISDDARLPAAGAGQDQHRALGGFDGFTLLRIQLVEKRQCGSGSRIANLILQGFREARNYTPRFPTSNSRKVASALRSASSGGN